MPPITEAIGGFRARRELQISAEVSQNCFPETRAPETEFSPKRRVAMLPTRGFTTFESAQRSPGPRVTGMTGTREPIERLAVVFGRSMYIYEDPAQRNRITRMDTDGRTRERPFALHPLYGVWAETGTKFWYTGRDGRMRVRIGAADPVVVDLRGLPAVATPIGLTGVSGTDNTVVWLTIAEDRRVHSYSTRAGRPAELTRQRGDNLDMAAAGCQQPESLYFLPAAGSTDGKKGTLAVLDGIGGDVYLFEYDADEPFGLQSDFGPRWRLISTPGLSNTFSLQTAVGSPDTRRPVLPGGVHITASEVTVIDRGGKRSVRFARGTGSVLGMTDLPAGIVGEPCGFVGGVTAPVVFVDDGQAGGGKMYDLAAGTQSPAGHADLTTSASDLTGYRPASLLPLDDSKRFIAWAQERKVHLIDMQERIPFVIQNVAGGIDSLTASAGRFVGCDRAEGILKVSPAGGRLTTAEEPVRRKTLDAAASLVVPGWPRSNPDRIRSLYVGARHLYVVSEVFDLYRYERGDIQADPVRIAQNVVYCCASGGTNTAGQLVIVRRGATDGSLHWAWYSELPLVEADLTRGISQGNVSRNLMPPWTFRSVRSVAADDGYLYVLFDPASGPRGEGNSWVYRASGQRIGALGTLHNPNTWGPPSDQGYTEEGIWGLDVAGNVLRAVMRSNQQDSAGVQRPTILRALRRNGETGYSAELPEYINTALTTNNTSLTHDRLFLYDVAFDNRDDLVLEDGTPTLATPAAAFWLADPNVRSAYRWDPERFNPDNSIVVSSVRGNVHSWSRTSMRIYEPNPGGDGFPYTLAAVRDVGCEAPNSISIVEEELFWLGAGAGGGVRVWRIGAENDTTPEAIVSPAAEEALAIVGAPLQEATAWTDDNGGHPAYVISIREPGLTLCYDTHAEEWHTRTSKRLPSDTGVNPFPWQADDQGHSRVEHSTLWRGRQYVGGYGVDPSGGGGGGIVAFPTTSEWTDIDGGPVERVRTFMGIHFERRRLRFGPLRIDVAYGVGDPEGTTPEAVAPRFSLEVSNDGGRTFGDPRWRTLARDRPPSAFRRLGSSRFRVYRIRCSDPIGFVILGVYTDPPTAGRKL